MTTGVTQKIIGAGASASAAYFGEDALFTSTGALLHVPDFRKLTFKNCIIDGKALGSWHPHAYQRVNCNGTVQIRTGGCGRWHRVHHALRALVTGGRLNRRSLVRQCCPSIRGV